MVRILKKLGMTIYVSWGSVVWSSLIPQVANYDSNLGLTKRIFVSLGRVIQVSLSCVQPNGTSSKQNEIWEFLTSCSMWHIWKARCSRLFDGKIVPPAQVVRPIWHEMVLTLKSRYDNIQGTLDAMIAMKSAFHKQWKGMYFFTGTYLSMEWNFTPLLGFFLLRLHRLMGRKWKLARLLGFYPSSQRL